MMSLYVSSEVCRYVSGTDRYLMQPCMVLLSSQTTACSFSRHLLTPQSKQVSRYLRRPGLLSKQLGLAMQGLQPLAVSLNLTEVQPWWHWNATIFKCHQRSQIIRDTVRPYCLSEKCISKNEHRWFWTNIWPDWIWTRAPSTAWTASCVRLQGQATRNVLCNNLCGRSLKCHLVNRTGTAASYKIQHKHKIYISKYRWIYNTVPAEFAFTRRIVILSVANSANFSNDSLYFKS